jgi:hypothetical protein
VADDTARAYRWVIRTIKADATIRALLSGEGAYRRVVPRGVAINVKPAIAVNRQGANLPVGHYLHTGAEQWTATGATIKTKIIYQGTDDTQLEPIADRLDIILDGKLYQDIEDSTVFSCVKQSDISTEEHAGDVTYLHHDIFWRILVRKD